MRHRRSLAYGLVGFVLGFGAPLGWLGWRVVSGACGPSTIAVEARSHLELYLYMLVSTCVVMALTGIVTGGLADRLDRAARHLEALATTDALTGLRNARSFHELMRIECARSERHARPFSLVMIDLDHFKRINDCWGHVVGDKALAHAAGALASAVRSGDIACRVGGEEFAVICPECDEAEAAQVAERLRAVLARAPLVIGSGAETLTGSFGVAAYSGALGQDDLISKADEALYRAKRNGRNQVARASQAEHEHAPDRPAGRPVTSPAAT